MQIASIPHQRGGYTDCGYVCIYIITYIYIYTSMKQHVTETGSSPKVTLVERS